MPIEIFSVWGACMSLRSVYIKKLYADIEFLLSDRLAIPQSSGGDNEICACYLFGGYEVKVNRELILRTTLRHIDLKLKNPNKFLSRKPEIIWQLYWHTLLALKFFKIRQIP